MDKCCHCEKTIDLLKYVRSVLIQVHNIIGFVPIMEAMHYIDITVEKINELILEHESRS